MTSSQSAVILIIESTVLSWLWFFGLVAPPSSCGSAGRFRGFGSERPPLDIFRKMRYNSFVLFSYWLKCREKYQKYRRGVSLGSFLRLPSTFSGCRFSVFYLLLSVTLRGCFSLSCAGLSVFIIAILPDFPTFRRSSTLFNFQVAFFGFRSDRLPLFVV